MTYCTAMPIGLPVKNVALISSKVTPTQCTSRILKNNDFMLPPCRYYPDIRKPVFLRMRVLYRIS